MPLCVVSTCDTKLCDDGIRFHHFPKDTKELGLWLDFCESDCKLDHDYATICSKHFSQEDYCMMPVLRKGAIPILNGPRTTKDLKKRRHKRNYEDDGSVQLPRKTKSGRSVNPPAALLDHIGHHQQLEDDEEPTLCIQNNEDHSDSVTDTDHDKSLSHKEHSNLDLELSDSNNLHPYSRDNSCSCCQEQVNLEKETRKLLENRLEKEKQKQREEKKKRKHLEKLLGASMQKQKATELRAAVAEEVLKAFTPSNFLTGSSFLEGEHYPPKEKKSKAPKGRWAWKKPGIVSSIKKSSTDLVKRSSTNLVKKPLVGSGNNPRLQVDNVAITSSKSTTSMKLTSEHSTNQLNSIPQNIEDQSVTLVQPNSPDSILGLHYNPTTVIDVTDDWNTPIVSYESLPPLQQIINKMVLDETLLPTNVHNSLHNDVESSSSPKLPSYTGKHQCLQCPFITNFKNEFTQHMAKHSTITSLYRCPKCSFTSKVKEEMLTHFKMHTTIKPNSNNTSTNTVTSKDKKRKFRCSQCSYQTTDKSCIINHEKSHFVKKSLIKAKLNGSSNNIFPTKKKSFIKSIN